MIRLPSPPRDGPRPRRLSSYTPERLEPRTLLATFVVTTQDDEGPGSLRQAILDANATPEADNVAFAVPGDAGTVRTMRPLSPLPTITSPLTLDATTQPGYSTSPLIELDGSAAGEAADGIGILARPTIVRGFAVNRFSRDGVAVYTPPRDLSTAAVIQISRSRIGTDAGGNQALPNGGAGIGIYDPNVLVGGNSVDDRNVISGNRGNGIRINVPNGGNQSVVRFNFIGTNVRGDAAIPNGASGVFVEQGFVRIADNLISGNAVNGVYTSATPSGGSATIEKNLIGTDATGATAIPNGAGPDRPFHGGIAVVGHMNVSIVSNTISGNRGHGITTLDARLTIAGNRIGTDTAGIRPLGNTGDGIRATGGDRVHIGRNVVCANAGDGVLMTGVVADADDPGWVYLNHIGTTPTALLGLGNAGNGITLNGCVNIDVGYSDGDSGAFNNNRVLIGGNGGHGIYVTATAGTTTPMGIAIYRNDIGLNTRDGFAAVPNGGSGIYFSGVTGADVFSNCISANNGDGVTITDRNGTRSTQIRVFSNAIGDHLRFRGSPTSATPAPGNRGNGVSIFNSSGNSIASYNRIAGNDRAGVRIEGNSLTRNLLSENFIGSNGGLGIDLVSGGEGVTPNDSGDVDSGPNLLQNHPVITGITDNGTSLTVHVRLQTWPDRRYRVELFSAAAPDSSGHGEGSFTGFVDVTTDGQGTATGTVRLSPATSFRGRWLSATATDSIGGYTSEFSPAVSAPSGRPVYRPPPPVRTAFRPEPLRNDVLGSETAFRLT